MQLIKLSYKLEFIQFSKTKDYKELPNKQNLTSQIRTRARLFGCELFNQTFGISDQFEVYNKVYKIDIENSYINEQALLLTWIKKDKNVHE